MAQLVAHRSDTAGVGGSNPFETTVAVVYWFADKNVALIDMGSIPISHPKEGTLIGLMRLILLIFLENYGKISKNQSHQPNQCSIIMRKNGRLAEGTIAVDC